MTKNNGINVKGNFSKLYYLTVSVISISSDKYRKLKSITCQHQLHNHFPETQTTISYYFFAVCFNSLFRDQSLLISGIMVEGSCTRYRNLWLHFTELRKLLLAIYQNANFFLSQIHTSSGYENLSVSQNWQKRSKTKRRKVLNSA